MSSYLPKDFYIIIIAGFSHDEIIISEKLKEGAVKNEKVR